MRASLRVWAWPLPVVAFAVAAACGSRTGLLIPGGAAEVPPGPPCDASLAPWLLFDLSDATALTSGGLYAMHADGTAGHMVNLPHTPAFFPSVSPDGTKLLYATFPDTDAGIDGGDYSVLYLYDFASRNSTLVVTTSQLTYSALSPDGRTVAYTTGYSLHDIAPDGTNDRALLVGPNCGTGYGHPLFTPDSSGILYGTGGLIGVISVDGSRNETLLTAIPGSFQYPNPAFSPDYQRMVAGVECDQDSPMALVVWSYASLPGSSCESGQVLVDVTEGAASNLANDPSWGANNLIAYGSGQDVYVIEASGGPPKNLTAALTGDGGTFAASDPVWAPGCADIP